MRSATPPARNRRYPANLQACSGGPDALGGARKLPAGYCGAATLKPLQQAIAGRQLPPGRQSASWEARKSILRWSNSSVTFLIAIVFAWVESHRESTSSVVSRPSARQATAVSIRPIAVAASDDENADHTLACRTGPAACLRRVCRRGRRVDQYHGVPHDADQLHRPHQCVLCCSHRASSRLLSLLSLCPQS
jgi:hypothetical protein